MVNLQSRKVPVFPGVNDTPRAPTSTRAGNGSDLIARLNGLITDIEPVLTALEEGAGNQAEIAALQQAVNVLDTAITELTSDTAALQGTNQSQQTAIASLADSVANLDGLVTNAIGENQAQNTAITALADSVEANTEELTAKAQAITALETSQGTQDQAITAVQTAIQNLQTELEALVQALGDNTGDNASQNAAIAAIQEKNSQQDQAITALETSQGTQDQALTNLQQTVSNQGQSIGSLQTENQTQGQAIAVATQKNDEQDQAITNLQTGLTNLQDSAGSLVFSVVSSFPHTITAGSRIIIAGTGTINPPDNPSIGTSFEIGRGQGNTSAIALNITRYNGANTVNVSLNNTFEVVTFIWQGETAGWLAYPSTAVTALLAGLFTVSPTTGTDAGIFEWLGRAEGSAAWQNPQSRGSLSLSAATGLAQGSFSQVTDRSFTDATILNLTAGTNNFFQANINTANRWVRVTHYAVGRPSSPNDHGLANWNFQGSTDGNTWVTLDSRTNSPISPGVMQLFALADNAQTQARYRQFRWQMTGNSTSGTTYYNVSELEIFGTVFNSQN